MMTRSSVAVFDSSQFQTQKGYNQQYAGLYFVRLQMMRSKLLETARKRWPNVPIVHKIIDVDSSECVLIGTVYADMPFKPNILDEVTAEQWIVPPPPRPVYYSDDPSKPDSFLLEDESGRLRLALDPLFAPLSPDHVLLKHPLVTGVVCAIRGKENAQGDFQVIDICHLHSLDPIPSPKVDIDPNGEYLVLCSGLSVGKTSPLKLQLLTDWLSGDLPSPFPVEKITRVVLAGNTLYRDGKESKPKDVNVKTVDEFLTSLVSSVDVDMISGPSDPVTRGWPQQAIFPLLFQNASTFSSFNTRTNPWNVKIAGKHLLGTSGENLDDICKYDYAFPLDGNGMIEREKMAKSILEWGHLAPTAPDTLWCYPFNDQDPFVLPTLPDLFFLGNQPGYSSHLYTDGKKHTRVILIPNFEETSQVVVVRLDQDASWCFKIEGF